TPRLKLSTDPDSHGHGDDSGSRTRLSLDFRLRVLPDRASPKHFPAIAAGYRARARPLSERYEHGRSRHPRGLEYKRAHIRGPNGARPPSQCALRATLAAKVGQRSSAAHDAERLRLS